MESTSTVSLQFAGFCMELILAVTFGDAAAAPAARVVNCRCFIRFSSSIDTVVVVVIATTGSLIWRDLPTPVNASTCTKFFGAAFSVSFPIETHAAVAAATTTSGFVRSIIQAIAFE